LSFVLVAGVFEVSLALTAYVIKVLLWDYTGRVKSI